MASMLWKVARDGIFLKYILPSVNMIPVRYKTHRKFPTKKKINPFVKPRTDLIKKLVLALVQHERIQTTHRKALQLKKYEAEAKEKMIKTRIVNRRSKKVLISPQVPNEQQYLERCRKAASDMLLGEQEAVEKLYSTLKERYKDKYGNFVKITSIPNPPRSTFPNMAYVELRDNSLPPLPKLPVVHNGRWVVYGSQDDSDDGNVVVQSQQ
ncbi:39S ribosomal protein L17 [Acropora cervicornis]|uniref:Large ribosomal subunit protein bL17m n=1 Tax=Acropora cervicornis TaxID=6130 RepID=A0AAD9VA80_ACRCE|nr:39S ribosomal protein L17 [Acropora cervicornis]